MLKKLRSLLAISLMLVAFLLIPLPAFAAVGWHQLLPNGAASSPPARSSNNISAWDSQSNRLLLFGGNNAANGSYFNDLWQYTPANGWQLLTAQDDPSAPHIRVTHSVTWDSQNNRLLVFGGFSDGGRVWNDLWEYTYAGGWQMLSEDGAPSSPPRRNDATLVWDTQDNRVLLFGGLSYEIEGTPSFNDLWEYTDANGWQLLTANGNAAAPAPRNSHGGVWDSQNNRLLIFGGRLFDEQTGVYSDIRNDLWEYSSDGGWQQLSANGDTNAASPRQRMSASWDADNNRMLIFGGSYDPPFTEFNTYFNDLWSFDAANGWQVVVPQGEASAPEPRRDHTAVWDTQLHRLLVFGGTIGYEINDLWQYGTVNTAPIVGTVTISPSSAQTNTQVEAEASFTDSNTGDTHTASINWGDGGGSQTCSVTESNGSGSVSCSLPSGYTSANVYEVTITVSDGTAAGISSGYASVYTPTQSSVFNAGQRFTSPLGAYLSNASLTGPVKFGLNYKYQGNTVVGLKQFSMDYDLANLHFDATTVSSLVVINSTGTIQGTGTLNGTSGYHFIVKGVNSGGIRIQITDSSNSVIYDTQPGAAISATPTTTVNGHVTVVFN